MENKLKHYILDTNSRMQSLKIVLEGLEHSKKELSNKELWSMGYLDPSDVEFYYGLKYLAIQNYLKRTINDIKRVFENVDVDEYYFYKLGTKIPNYNYNKIQLIRACANYFKHKEDTKRNNTKEVLDNFGLQIPSKEEIDECTLLTGAADFINPTANIEVIYDILKTWREIVIEEFYKISRPKKIDYDTTI